MSRAALPQIGQPWPDLPLSQYQGISTSETGELYALVVLADRPPKPQSQAQQMAWAASLGADLPSPSDCALLMQTRCAGLPQTWCWTNKLYGSSCAWFCFFFSGGIYFNFRSSKGAAVAVRRFPIDPSILFGGAQ